MSTAVSSETFEAMWEWLCFIAESARADIPYAIHSQSGDRTNWGNVPKDVTARGLPFSTSFLRRVDHALPVALQEALGSLKPAADTPWALRAVRRSQWRIVVAVLRDGRTDIAECRGYMKMPDFAFQVAATGGILALRSALGRE